MLYMNEHTWQALACAPIHEDVDPVDTIAINACQKSLLVAMSVSKTEND